jgi:putative Holliday junction resolvase
MRVIALDYGSARCGVALSDPTGTIVTPLEHIERPGTKRGMGAVVGTIDIAGAEHVVVGLPISLKGKDTAQTKETREFARRLQQRLKIPVELFDERFTTRLAQQDPPGSRASEDSRAAAHLLESWLAGRVQEP